MITPYMDYSEIRHELEKEYHQVLRSADMKYAKYQKKILKYRISLNRTFVTYKSPHKNNYLIIFTSDEEGFGCTILCYYENKQGFNYAILAQKEEDFILWFYTPHHLKRYRERMCLPASLIPLKVVEKWSEHNALSCSPLTELPPNKVHKERLCLFTREGCALGYQNKAEKYLVMKTFISNAMLKGKQTALSEDALEEIRQQFELNKRLNDRHYWIIFLKKIREQKNKGANTWQAA